MSEICAKILKNIFADAVLLETEDGGIDGETLALCFLEEVIEKYSTRKTGESTLWKRFVADVVQDVGGFSSDVGQDIVADIERQGGETFLKKLFKEVRDGDTDPYGSIHEGMRCKAIESVTGEFMDAEIVGIDQVSGEVEVLFTSYGKRQYLSLEELSFPFVGSTKEAWQEVGEGACSICLRTLPLTAHHLIPKTMHAHYVKKGTHTRDQLNQCVDLCRACHSNVHKTENCKDLAEHYNTIELLLEHPKIKKFANYISKQKTTKHNSDNRLVPARTRRKKNSR
jgi:hypothetical protein|eukprot:g183.t1